MWLSLEYSSLKLKLCLSKFLLGPLCFQNSTDLSKQLYRLYSSSELLFPFPFSSLTNSCSAASCHMLHFLVRCCLDSWNSLLYLNFWTLFGLFDQNENENRDIYSARLEKRFLLWISPLFLFYYLQAVFGQNNYRFPFFLLFIVVICSMYVVLFSVLAEIPSCPSYWLPACAGR